MMIIIRFIYIYLLFNIIYGCVECETHRNVHNRGHLRDTYEQIYGQAERRFERWDRKAETALGYPSGDKEKLAQIANLWSDYYECTYRLVATVTSTGRLPSTVQMVYVGSVARLSCGLCIAPDEGYQLVWSFAKNFSFLPLHDDHRYVRGIDGNLTIYSIRTSDAGVYNCRVGKSISGLVILEVVDEEDYSVVKPSSSLGPYPIPSETMAGLQIFTAWSRWSQCSHCGRVGLRRRYGMCYVKALFDQSKSSTLTHSTQLDNDLIFDNLTRKLFENYPEGVPCKSQHLPRRIRKANEVQGRRNEIMIGMCKVHCTTADSDDEVIDQATLPIRTITFAAIGQTLVMRCPGTTLCDTPIIWRVGAKQILPYFIHKMDQENAHVNARDHLIFTKIKYSDANLYRYSCWQRDRLAGTVQLAVWSGEATCCNRYTALLAMVIAAGVVLRYAERTLRNTQRRLGIT